MSNIRSTMAASDGPRMRVATRTAASIPGARQTGGTGITRDAFFERRWAAWLFRLGHARVISAITAFSIVAAVVFTLALSLLSGQSGHQVIVGVVMSAVVAAIVAPMASWLVVQLSFELADAHARLRELALRDNLTQSYNRHYFMQRLDDDVADCVRTQRPLALLMIDADGFKAINDRHGHAVGDRSLVEIARTCGALLGTGDVLARFGGEEFVALLPDHSLKSACVVAERMRVAVEALRIDSPHGGPIGVTVSVGVAVLSSNCADAAALLERADTALYAAKRDGRNRWAS